MDPDTDIGGAQQRFPVTNQSAIAAARSDDHVVRQRAFDTILTSYWKPAYKYIRLKWHADNEDAKDLTQGFFAHAFEKNYFATYDARKASFQTFLRTCLDGFVANPSELGSSQAYIRQTQRDASCNICRAPENGKPSWGEPKSKAGSISRTSMRRSCS